MTTNNQNVDNSTSVLVKESQLAQLAEERAAERDRVNTRLCYERALGYFYEEEGINPEDEKDAKIKEEEEHKKLDNMSLVEEYKYKFNKFKEDLKDPIRKKIRFAEISGIIISIFRALILFGLFIVFGIIRTRKV